MSKSGKVDFNNPNEFSQAAKKIIGNKLDKKSSFSITDAISFVMEYKKTIIGSVIYLCLCGLGLNIYWIVKLISKLF